MSIVSNNTDNSTGKRFAELAKMGEQVFHTSDLANLWAIKNKNTLYMTLSRYHKRGLLNRIYKGLYSLQTVDKIDPYLLGIKALNKFAYLSCETVLADNGIIFQSSDSISLVSSQSKKFSIAKNNYQSRQLQDKYLFNTAGIKLKDGYYQATTERAVADMLYFNPYYYFDAAKLINWSKVKKLQKEIGYDVSTR